MKKEKQTKKDFKAVKRALKVFKDKERLSKVQMIIVSKSKDTTININL